MRRALFAVVWLVAASSSACADDLEICRDNRDDLVARQAACEAIIASGKVTGKSLAVAYQVRGDAMVKKRDSDGAIAAFTAAHDADPDNPGYLNSRGIVYGNRGQDDRAMADFNLSVDIRPNYASAISNRGWLLMRKGDPASLDGAIDAFSAAVKYNYPSRYIAYFSRARVLTVKGQYDLALNDFAEALRLNPAATQVQGYRCVTYTAMGQYDQAIADCSDMLAKAPKAIYALASRGDAYLGKGDFDAALRDFDAALAISPNSIRAYALRGKLYEKRGDLRRARADYRSASAASTPYDDIDIGMARRMARERLAALTAPVAGNGNQPSQTVSPTGGRRIALVVGNGRYKRVQSLTNPPRDAELIAKTLRDVGFQSVTMVADLTRDKFFSELQAFAREAEMADWAVVYYAGHGIEIGGVNYMVPIDATLASDRDAETEAVSLEQVIAAVGGARKLRLVMLDACRDDPFQTRMQKTIAFKLVNKGLANIEPDAGTMVVYAAKHGETALDGDSKNSPFATALAREMKEPRVEVRKLFDIVRDDVWAASNRQQQPFTYGSPPGREDFYFVAAK